MKYAYAAAALATVASATYTQTVDVTVTSCGPSVTDCAYKSATWANWDPATTTTSTWATWDPKTTSTTAWSDWDPATTTSTWGTWDPKPTTSAWSEWDPTTTSTWGTWDPKPTTTAWGTWDPTTTTAWSAWTTTNTASCPVYTATAAPAWFSQLPSDVLSKIEAQWTGAPPADWCYYTYSASTVSPVAATSTWASWTTAPASVPVQPAGTSASWSAVQPIATFKGDARANAASYGVAGLAAAAALILA